METKLDYIELAQSLERLEKAIRMSLNEDEQYAINRAYCHLTGECEDAEMIDQYGECEYCLANRMLEECRAAQSSK
jgi:hypothetical protein